jgi:hypothetical protein
MQKRIIKNVRNHPISNIELLLKVCYVLEIWQNNFVYLTDWEENPMKKYDKLEEKTKVKKKKSLRRRNRIAAAHHQSRKQKEEQKRNSKYQNKRRNQNRPFDQQRNSNEFDQLLKMFD